MEILKIKVGGMSCSHCQRNVERNLAKIAGVSRVEVSLETTIVEIVGEGLNLEEIRKVIEKIGYQVNAVIQ